MIVRKTLRMIGHNLTHPEIVALILETMIEGGRQKVSYGEQIIKDTGYKFFSKMKRLSNTREK